MEKDPASIPVMAIWARAAALGGLFAFSGCSSLKLSSLHDARVLEKGDYAVSVELGTAASVERALALSAGSDSLLSEARVREYSRHADPGGILLVGANLARGLGDGWEINGGANLALFGFGTLLADAGLKKRLYANPRMLLTAYGRMAIGTAPNNLSWYDTTARTGNTYALETRTLEVDAQMLALARIFRNLSFYLNAGPTVGNIDYEIEQGPDKPKRENDAGFYGAKTHIGLILETRRFEMAGELGYHFLSYGYVPSAGVRATLKTDWLR